MNKNEFEFYRLNGESYKFKKAPIYNKESCISLEKKIKQHIREKNFIGKQRLVKFDILGNKYSDIFTLYKIFPILSMGETVVFLNHHYFTETIARKFLPFRVRNELQLMVYFLV